MSLWKLILLCIAGGFLGVFLALGLWTLVVDHARLNVIDQAVGSLQHDYYQRFPAAPTAGS